MRQCSQNPWGWEYWWHSRERVKGMNWDGLERLIESCVGNESINRKGLIRAVIAQKKRKG